MTKEENWVLFELTTNNVYHSAAGKRKSIHLQMYKRIAGRVEGSSRMRISNLYCPSCAGLSLAQAYSVAWERH